MVHEGAIACMCRTALGKLVLGITHQAVTFIVSPFVTYQAFFYDWLFCALLTIVTSEH